MKYNVSGIVEGHDFYVEGMSYIGEPKSNTAMFISKKVERLLSALEPVDHCLVFAENGITVPDSLMMKHAFYFSKQPQLDYAKFAVQFFEERNKEERSLKFELTQEGYYKSETAVIGKNAYIEPGCLIGHNVTIGDNARILTGSVIRYATIGNNFVSNEYAVIGAFGFTMTEDDNGNKLRIPTLGGVTIGDNVEVGAHDNISCGSAGNTIIDDNVKIDALVHIGHDVHLHKNVEVTAGGIVGGFGDIGDHAYVGINAVLRNRITIGDNTIVGMGSTVTKSFGSNVTVVGNPAAVLNKGE